jgi:hypothetical protein
MTKKLTIALACIAGYFTTHAQVTTLAGSGNAGYSASGTAAASAQFSNPYGVAFDTKGNLWITDAGNNFLILINAGKYELREGQAAGGFQDGNGASLNGGLVNNPAGIVVVPGITYKSDQVYLCDAGNNSIRKIDSFVDLGHSQTLKTVAGGGTKVKGQPGSRGHVNGAGTTALFDNPTSVTYVKNANGDYLLVADKGNSGLRKISLKKSDYGTVSDFAMGINNVEGVFADPANNYNIYVAQNSGGGGISQVSSTGAVTQIVPGQYLSGPTSVVTRGTEMYIADGCRIMFFDMKKAASATNPVVFAGDRADTICDFKDGANNIALFDGIGAITLSADLKSLVIADAVNNRIRQIALPHSSGIEQASLPASDMFNVYPNPAFGHIAIKGETSGKANISLLNVTGQVVANNTVELIAGVPYDMQIDNRAPGIYVLQIASGTGVYSQKIVLK